jgi:hypothetical protein
MLGLLLLVTVVVVSRVALVTLTVVVFELARCVSDSS